MNNKVVLICEDEENILNLLDRLLSQKGYKTLKANNGLSALEILKARQVDVVITDIRMPGLDGIGLLKEIKTIDPFIEVLIMTAFATVDTAIAAVKMGARDYIKKPFDIDEVISAVERAALLVDHNNEEDFLNLSATDMFVAESDSMKQLKKLILKVASSSATVNIHGETGVGKELVAKSIHELSPRKDQPFIQVNCSAFPESLLESELFGYVKGAFTGALDDKPGRFELANGGTIFLDEIGDISPIIQLKLLRVIQQKEVERLGSTKTLALDIRVITATNKDLGKLVSENKFREDLFYRLNVIPIEVAPLRDRKQDIPDLLKVFMGNASFTNKTGQKILSEEALKSILSYSWPGNVRELENVVERLIVISEGPVIGLSDLPEPIRGGEKRDFSSLDLHKDEVEERLIRKALKDTGGNVTKAAEKIGISRRSLYRKLHKHHIFSDHDDTM